MMEAENRNYFVEVFNTCFGNLWESSDARHGILVSVDSTMMPPVICKPLTLGLPLRVSGLGFRHA